MGIHKRFVEILFSNPFELLLKVLCVILSFLSIDAAVEAIRI